MKFKRLDQLSLNLIPNIEHCTMLVHSRIKFKLDNCMFTEIRQYLATFRKNKNPIKSAV